MQYMFREKKTCKAIKAHELQKKCWVSVAVDLFIPMSSSKHIVMVQDLVSRYPAARLVSLTGANHILPASADIYNDLYGKPDYQPSTARRLIRKPWKLLLGNEIFS